MESNLSSITLDDKQKEELVQLGSLRWPYEKIAQFFGWDLNALKEDISQPNSEIHKLLLKGELQADFKIEARVLAGAQSGDLPSVKEFAELMRDRSFKFAKLDIFGGAVDEDVFEKIDAYLSRGEQSDISVTEQYYVDLLEIVYSFEVRFGVRRTIQFLTQRYGYDYHRARSVVNEAIELFNAGRDSSREAMRSHMADTYDTLYHAVIESAKDIKDYALAASILEKKAKVLRLDQPDPEQLPKEEYRRQYRVLSLDPVKSLGLPEANRAELEAQINALQLPEATTRRLKMEAGIIDTDIVEMLQNATEETS